MTKPVAVTDQSFEAEVLKSDKPVLVDFWAEWCAPCRMIAPIVDELSIEYDGKVKFMKMDVDSNGNTPMTFGIRGIPTLIIFKGGKPVEQVVGAVPKSVLKKRLDAAIAAPV
ncbi:MAG: thioredoxin [Dehalococcoidia bacterium]|nr:thioredoxin [Dehalococcoidia bacterium]